MNKKSTAYLIFDGVASVLAFVLLFTLFGLLLYHASRSMACVSSFNEKDAKEQGTTLQDASTSYPWHLFPLARYATRDADGAVTFHLRKPSPTPQPVAGYHPADDAYRWRSLGPQWVLPRDLWGCAEALPWRESLRERSE